MLPNATSIKEPTYTPMANFPLSDVIALVFCTADYSTITSCRERLPGEQRLMPSTPTLTRASSGLLTIKLDNCARLCSALASFEMSREKPGLFWSKVSCSNACKERCGNGLLFCLICTTLYSLMHSIIQQFTDHCCRSGTSPLFLLQVIAQGQCVLHRYKRTTAVAPLSVIVLVRKHK